MYEEVVKKEKNISKLPKIKIVTYLRDLLKYTSTLHRKIALLEKEISDEKIKQINLKVNCPTSKLPEWVDKSGRKSNKNSDAKSKNNNQIKRKKKNEGAGNKEKKELTLASINTTSSKSCLHCECDLREMVPFETFSRIIEDISNIPETTNITLEKQERMKCPNCKKKVTGQSEAALAKSDIGINTTIVITYLWVLAAMSLPKISDYLNSFFVMKISSAGISKMMIRVGNILRPIYYVCRRSWLESQRQASLAR